MNIKFITDEVTIPVQARLHRCWMNMSMQHS